MFKMLFNFTYSNAQIYMEFRKFILNDLRTGIDIACKRRIASFETCACVCLCGGGVTMSRI